MTPDASFGPVIVAAVSMRSSVPSSTYKHIILVLKRQREKKKYSPWAQTTHLALFGPIIILVTFDEALGLPSILYISFSIKKEQRKKNSPRAQMMRLASFGPVTVTIAFQKALCTFKTSVAPKLVI